MFCFCLKIREDTDTKIELPSEKSNSDVIVITGKKEQVEKAKQMLLKMEQNLVRFLASMMELVIRCGVDNDLWCSLCTLQSLRKLFYLYTEQ